MALQSTVLIIVLTLIAGYSDSKGFIYANRVWTQGYFAWDSAIKSALGFTMGIPCYWLAVRFLQNSGIVAAELQATLWFASTIIGVAVASGSYFYWNAMDKTVAILVVAGMVWLLVRTGA